jgi:hypothetical protein
LTPNEIFYTAIKIDFVITILIIYHIKNVEINGVSIKLKIVKFIYV